LTPPFIFMARTVATMTVADGFSPAFAHLMSKNFSAPRSAPKTGLGHHIVGELQRRRSGDHRVAAMRDVGERAAMTKAGCSPASAPKFGDIASFKSPSWRVGLEIARIDRGSCRGR